MARKSKRSIEPELPQEELEESMTKHTRTISAEGPSVKGRIRGATAVPQGDAPSGDVLEVMTMTLTMNGDVLGWGHKEAMVEGTATNWATILLRDIRYGIPLEELGGEGWHIREDDKLGEPPTCDNCEEELAA